MGHKETRNRRGVLIIIIRSLGRRGVMIASDQSPDCGGFPIFRGGTVRYAAEAPSATPNQ
jgi:hypothetical protein